VEDMLSRFPWILSSGMHSVIWILVGDRWRHCDSGLLKLEVGGGACTYGLLLCVGWGIRCSIFLEMVVGWSCSSSKFHELVVGWSPKCPKCFGLSDLDVFRWRNCELWIPM